MRHLALALAAIAALAMPSCKKKADPRPQPVVLGPPVQIDYCTPEIDRRMTACVPTCGPCEYKGGGHICRFKPEDERKAVDTCIAACRKKAEAGCLRSR